MIKDLVRLSDWIQYLLTIRNIGFAIIGVLITVIISLIGFTLFQNFSIYIYIETCLVLFFLICLTM